MSTGVHGSQPRRSTCISNGSARASAAAWLTPAQKRSSWARSAGSSSLSSRRAIRRIPKVRINRSTAIPSSPAISATLPSTTRR
jgi:hypothetical protein